MAIEESVEEEEVETGSHFGAGGGGSKRRGIFRRSDTVGEIQVTCPEGPRLRGFLRRANTVDQMGTDERDRLLDQAALDDDGGDDESLEPDPESAVRVGNDVREAFTRHFLAYPALIEDDPFDVSLHAPSDFDEPPPRTLQKVEHNPRVSRMSWSAGDRENKFLLESMFSEPNPSSVLDVAFTKLYPADMRIDYMDQESTPSLQSISSGSESQRGGQRGMDVDSLSEEGDSDESGFVETTTADDKIRDLPSHQLIKPKLDPSKSASLHV